MDAEEGSHAADRGVTEIAKLLFQARGVLLWESNLFLLYDLRKPNFRDFQYRILIEPPYTLSPFLL